MIPLSSLTAAEEQVYGNATALITRVRRAIKKEPSNASEATSLVRTLRSTVYEDMNQIQHENLILRGARWLIAESHVSENVEWRWNPRQTGPADEPDLSAIEAGRQIVSAEATTSAKPDGVIDRKMATRLRNL